MSGEMRFALIAGGSVFLVSILAQTVLPRFLVWLADKMIASAVRDPYFNRDYARPRRSRCQDCSGSGRCGRWQRCPTCLGKESHRE